MILTDLIHSYFSMDVKKMPNYGSLKISVNKFFEKSYNVAEQTVTVIYECFVVFYVFLIILDKMKMEKWNSEKLAFKLILE